MDRMNANDRTWNARPEGDHYHVRQAGPHTPEPLADDAPTHTPGDSHMEWTYDQDGSAAIKRAYRTLANAYETTPCTCGPLETSSVCDCTVAQFGAAADALRISFPLECDEVARAERDARAAECPHGAIDLTTCETCDPTPARDALDEIDRLADEIAARNESEAGGMHHDLARIHGAARMLREIYAGRETIARV